MRGLVPPYGATVHPTPAIIKSIVSTRSSSACMGSAERAAFLGLAGVGFQVLGPWWVGGVQYTDKLSPGLYPHQLSSLYTLRFGQFIHFILCGSVAVSPPSLSSLHPVVLNMPRLWCETHGGFSPWEKEAVQQP